MTKKPVITSKALLIYISCLTENTRLAFLHNTQYLTQLPHMRKFLSFSDLTKGKLIYFASFAHY